MKNDYCVYYREKGELQGELLVPGYTYEQVRAEAEKLAADETIESVEILKEVELIKQPKYK
jgi:hypothetical protein